MRGCSKQLLLMRYLLCFMIGLSPLLFGFSATAQSREVPYWASLKFDEVNMRVGPSGDYKIDWVYKRKGLPVKVVRLLEGWRLIEEPDGTRGWVAESQLLLTRTAIIKGDGLAAMRSAPNASASIKWQAEVGVSGELGECEMGWCEFNVGGREGWVMQDRLWGAGAP